MKGVKVQRRSWRVYLQTLVSGTSRLLRRTVKTLHGMVWGVVGQSEMDGDQAVDCFQFEKMNEKLVHPQQHSAVYCRGQHKQGGYVWRFWLAFVANRKGIDRWCWIAEPF